MDMEFLLKMMKENGASDLHIVAGVPPIFRINGELKPFGERKITPAESTSLIYSLMNEEQKKNFEKIKELDFSFGISGTGRFRINAHFQRGSMAAAVRHISNNIPSISELNLPPILNKLALTKQGMVLVTGPTGCGKSTTLAAMVEIINKEKAFHIIIIEDPIEYLHSHKKSIVEQREVGNDTFSFANALKYALRQDPDVILIGELRDLETISTAITAAETGHLILGTLHTPDAPQAIDRLVGVFPPYQQPQIRMQLSTSLQVIINQRLLLKKNEAGRVPAVELLIATPAVSNLIRSGKTHQLYTVIQTGEHIGMQTMDQALKKLVDKRLINFETALQKARDPKNFQSLFTKSK